VDFDWWPLAARGDIIFPLGIWLLTPWITHNLPQGTSPRALVITLPLWVGVAAGVAVLATGLTSNYHDIDGSIAAAEPVAEPQDAATQPAEDWHDYGRTQFGQRYSPPTQITPGCLSTGGGTTSRDLQRELSRQAGRNLVTRSAIAKATACALGITIVLAGSGSRGGTAANQQRCWHRAEPAGSGASNAGTGAGGSPAFVW